MTVSAEAYLHNLQDPIRASLRAAMRRETAALARVDATAPPPNADRLTDLLRRAVDWGVTGAGDGFMPFVHTALEAINRYGVGEEFRRRDELDAALAEAADALALAGRSTTDLHLARAQLLAIASNGGQARRDAIDVAIRSAHTLPELLRARLVLANFWLDRSDYGRGRAVLDHCEATARARCPDDHGLLAHILVTRALTYVFKDERRAVVALEAVLAHARAVPPSPEVDAAAGGAHHYLGRIAATRGRYREALDHMVTGQRLGHRWAEPRRAPLAYYHLRLAEVLLLCGSEDEVLHHLEQATAMVRLVQESSNAEAQIDAARARLHLRQGDWRTGATILRAAIRTHRRDEHVRGELTCTAQLARSYLAGRRYLEAAAAARRAVHLWWRTERTTAMAVPGTSIRRSAGVALRAARQTTARRSGNGSEILRCPCGDDHRARARHRQPHQASGGRTEDDTRRGEDERRPALG